MMLCLGRDAATQHALLQVLLPMLQLLGGSMELCAHPHLLHHLLGGDLQGAVPRAAPHVAARGLLALLQLQSRRHSMRSERDEATLHAVCCRCTAQVTAAGTHTTLTSPTQKGTACALLLASIGLPLLQGNRHSIMARSSPGC